MSSAPSHKRKARNSLSITSASTSDNDEDDSRKISRKSTRKRSAASRKSPPAKSWMSQNANARGSSSEQVSDPTGLNIASYNVWFGPHTGPLYDSERMNAIVSTLLEYSPNLVGLQEVTPSLARVLCPRLESAGYQVVLQDTKGVGYGCAVATKVDSVIASGFHPFQHTNMGRGIVWALVRLHSKEILFTTTHLESFVKAYSSGQKDYDGVEQRADQIVQLAMFCQDCLEERASTDAAVITGDLNWDDERPRGSGIDRNLLDLIDKSRWIDAWKVRNPKLAGYTYDSKANPMLRGNLRRRLDRCLVYSKKPVSVEETHLIGMEPLPGLVWTKEPHPLARSRQPSSLPVTQSDHFGLIVSLKSA